MISSRFTFIFSLCFITVKDTHGNIIPSKAHLSGGNHMMKQQHDGQLRARKTTMRKYDAGKQTIPTLETNRKVFSSAKAGNVRRTKKDSSLDSSRAKDETKDKAKDKAKDKTKDKAKDKTKDKDSSIELSTTNTNTGLVTKKALDIIVVQFTETLVNFVEDYLTAFMNNVLLTGASMLYNFLRGEEQFRQQTCIDSGLHCAIGSKCCDGLFCNLSSSTCEPSSAIDSSPEEEESMCVEESSKCMISSRCCEGLYCNIGTLTCERENFFQFKRPPSPAPTSMPTFPPTLPDSCVAETSRCKLRTPCCDGLSCDKKTLTCTKDDLEVPIVTASPTITPQITTSSPSSPSVAEILKQENDCVDVNNRCKLNKPCCEGYVCDIFSLTCQLTPDAAESFDDSKEATVAAVDTIEGALPSKDMAVDTP